MANAWIHATSSVKRYKGNVADYIPIHELMDSSKLAVADNRHRSLTHHNWFVCNILPRIFGDTITNSDGKMVSVRQIGLDHVQEDFGGRYIPTAQDYLENLPMEMWFNNGVGNTFPPSARKLQGINSKMALDAIKKD